MSILILVVFMSLSISGMCSLFEAVLYSTRIGTLEAVKAKDKKKSLAEKLLHMKREISVPIASILVLNTIANTAGATIAGMYAAKELGTSLVPLFSIFFTFSILFFSEIIPKTVGAVRWRGLWPYIVWPLIFMKTILNPLIFFIRRLMNVLTKDVKFTTITEEEIIAAARIGAKEGEITEQEHLIIDNLINLENRIVREIMTPRTVIFSLEANLTVQEALEIANEKGLTRIPVYEQDKENIIGYVMFHDISSAKNLVQPPRTLKDIVRTISFVPENTNCLLLLFDFLKARKHIAIVTDEFHGVAGLVTLEDLIETLLGTEIVDETDKVIDLQKIARKKKMR